MPTPAPTAATPIATPIPICIFCESSSESSWTTGIITLFLKEIDSENESVSLKPIEDEKITDFENSEDSEKLFEYVKLFVGSNTFDFVK